MVWNLSTSISLNNRNVNVLGTTQDAFCTSYLQNDWSCNWRRHLSCTFRQKCVSCTLVIRLGQSAVDQITGCLRFMFSSKYIFISSHCKTNLLVAENSKTFPSYMMRCRSHNFFSLTSHPSQGSSNVHFPAGLFLLKKRFTFKRYNNSTGRTLGHGKSYTFLDTLSVSNLRFQRGWGLCENGKKLPTGLKNHCIRLNR